jgi:hypothetical protein
VEILEYLIQTATQDTFIAWQPGVAPPAMPTPPTL